ncbi:putative ankyrin repeat protein [Rosellinia necatrix]|uniref:Putative ankyrin repeat protein n=1 Tax=Rosellinia necatrix TaxID=77044 RepID=A0A1S7UNK6_ROSNE|nr:putative ankyrin repeat protein [Rosellinia necatrix]
MGIHEDVRQGKLVEYLLDSYIRANPNVLDEQYPSDGRTPLGAAVVAGYTDMVKLLLKKLARADAPSKGGWTPLLLAATTTRWDYRPRIIQLLLERTPPNSVDKTGPVAGNKTPLMFAIKNKDIESIRLLRRAGASLDVKNDDGLTANQMAIAASDETITQALYPEKEEASFRKISSLVVSVLLTVVSRINVVVRNFANRVVQMAPGVAEKVKRGIEKLINRGTNPSKDQFVKNVDRFVNEKPVLSRFFKGRPEYIQEVAKNMRDLENDTSTPLGNKQLLPKTVEVSMHQQVLYCDDSGSMSSERRWESQAQLVRRIAQITTRILPDGEGVALRFINKDINNSDNLTLDGIRIALEQTSPGGGTAIGTNLKSKILEPLVYSRLNQGGIKRPFLISIITDGEPSEENESALADAILECGRKLEAAGLPRKTVNFMIGQVGATESARGFLNGLRGNRVIADMVFVTTDQLDARLADLHANQAGLDQWLIETLFSTFKKD